MRNFLYNLNYFRKETFTIFKVDLLSNILSIFSIGLIFFILSLMSLGWWVGNDVVKALENEAEINIYFKEDVKEEEISRLLESIERIDGVISSKLIEEEESYDRMTEILGKEANILELFEQNPFDSFLEIKVDMTKTEKVIQTIGLLNEVDYIRDNKEVIDKIEQIVSIITILGILIILAVGISTLVVVSHIIRQGIYSNREQIGTLKLLGAPKGFIGFPFFMEGLFLTLAGGIVSAGLCTIVLNYLYTQTSGGIQFIPLPNKESLILFVWILSMSSSLLLGIIGSSFGLKSAQSA